MPEYSQTNRPLRVDTPLGTDKLLLLGFSGVEAVSRPFSFQLQMMSEDDAVDGRKLLRQPASVTVRLADDSERVIHGIISRFTQGNRRDNFTFYNAELVPALWLLSLSHDCRVFQNLSVIEIIEKVFKQHGLSDYDVRCTTTYQKRPYTVQYRESDLNFVSRLMEEEGIFYFHEHTRSKHVLALADSNATMRAFPGNDSARIAVHAKLDEDIVTEFHREDSVYVGAVTLRDYDPLEPAISLHSTVTGPGKQEVFDYQPVIFTKPGEGDRFARLRLESLEALQQVARGRSTCRFFESGRRFELVEHSRSDMNIQHLVLEVRHTAESGDYRSWDTGPFEYSNEFVTIPATIPYRPPRLAAKPIMRGAQTAVVVGKSGEEIWTDKYGRVKIQFHWDREGSNNEDSSCWVRVSSAWAGKTWGMVHIPRIGQEVVVDFLEGDPDRPIITGSVYNGEQMPPYALPTNQTQSGVKSRSTKGGGNEEANEIRFEDKKGSELVYVHGQKDQQILIENDRTEEVKHDEKITIGNDRTEEVKKNESITIGENRTEKVGKDETITIAGGRTEQVDKDEKITIKGKRDHETKGDEKLTVGGKQDGSIGSDRTFKIGSNDKLDVGSNLDIKANSNINIKAVGGKIVAEAATGIELKVGASTIKITPSGIELKAPQIKIQGMAQLEFKAPMVTGKADGMLQLQGPMTQLKGDGLLIVKGGVTMIN